MNHTKVLHLVSNSFTHPENTASSFKVSYNVPFDLRGRKIALVDATLTKAQDNVLQEKITFTKSYKTKKRPIKKLKKFNHASHLITLPNIENSWDNLFKLMHGDIIANGQPVISIASDYESATKNVTFTIVNKTSSEVTLQYYTNYKNPIKGWNLLMTEPDTLEKNNVVDAEKTISTITITNTVKLRFEIKESEEKPNKSNASYYVQVFKLLFSFHEITMQPLPKEISAFQPGPRYFVNITDFIHYLNNMSGFGALATLALVYGKVVLSVGAGITEFCDIDLGGLNNHLGFDDSILRVTPEKRVFSANRPPDMTRGTHHFYIYCSLVRSVAINEKNLPLLATVDATKGNYAEQMVHPIQFPLFVDCESGPTQVIEVTISDDVGNIEGLLMGRTKLTLAIQ